MKWIARIASLAGEPCASSCTRCPWNTNTGYYNFGGGGAHVFLPLCAVIRLS